MRRRLAGTPCGPAARAPAGQRPALRQCTVTVAVALFVEPHEFDTRTQYDVVAPRRGVVYDDDVAPAMGDAVFPDAPTYH